jgi:hypothetical protein
MEKITQKDLIFNVIGHEENFAISWIRQMGYSVFIYDRDGQLYIKTTDLNFNRVNVKIEGGVVTQAHIG